MTQAGKIYKTFLPGRQQALPPLLMAALLTSAAVMAVLFGAIAGLGNVVLVILVLGGALVLTLAGFPIMLIYIVAIGGMVVSGLAQLYAPAVQQIRWMVAGFALILPFSILLTQLGIYQKESLPQPPLTRWIVVTLICAVASSMFNITKLGSLVLGWKDYFQVWGLLLAFAMLSFNLRFYRALPKIFLAIAFIQLPFAIQQFLFIVPEREGLRAFGVVPVDIVVGTFGGDRAAGGNNALLAVFQVFVFAILVARYKVRLISGFRFSLMSILVLAPLFLNETRVAVVFIVMVVFIVFRKEMLARPVYFVGIAGAATLFSLALLLSYGASNDSDQGSISDIVEKTIHQNTDEKAKYGLLELNRLSSLTFWAHEHSGKRWTALFFGHGLGESKEGLAGYVKRGTLAETAYSGMGIGLTALSGMLWDIGIIGTFVVLAMFVSAYRLAGKLAHEFSACKEQFALFLGIQAGAAVLFLSLAHKAFFVFLIGYQVFVVMVFGYLIYTWRHRAAILSGCVDDDNLVVARTVRAL